MIPRPQMIPKMDRKWSSTASDPLSRPQMIPWKLEEWNGFHGTDYQKGLIIKKKPFSTEEYKAGHPPHNKSFIAFTDLFESVKLISQNISFWFFSEVLILRDKQQDICS